MITSETIDQLRGETPGLSNSLFMDSAGDSLMPSPVADKINSYLELEMQVGGYEAERLRMNEINGFHEAVGDLLNCQIRNVAFAESATIAYASVLSSLDLDGDTVIVTSEDDYISNQIMFLSLQARRGVRFERAASLPEGGIDPASVDELLTRHRGAVVAVTHVPTNSGLVQDVSSVGEICRKHEAVYLVDACQSVGQLPVDVQEIGCDYLTASTRKFLRGPRGTGFLYASDRALASGRYPLFVDMRGADWTGPNQFSIQETARRFETWESPYAFVVGAARAVRYANSIRIASVAERNSILANRLRAGLESIGARVLDRGVNPCSIVTTTFDGHTADVFESGLRGQGVLFSMSLREYAQVDFPRKEVTWAVRLSPHYFNTESEIDDVLAACARTAGAG